MHRVIMDVLKIAYADKPGVDIPRVLSKKLLDYKFSGEDIDRCPSTNLPFVQEGVSVGNRIYPCPGFPEIVPLAIT